MFVDYFHDKAANAIEMTIFQARHNQFNTMADPLNDESAFQNETDFEQTSYWPTYFNAHQNSRPVCPAVVTVQAGAATQNTAYHPSTFA